MLFLTLGRSFRTLFSASFIGLAAKMALVTLVAFGLFMTGIVGFIMAYNPFRFDEHETIANAGIGIFTVMIGWFLLPTLLPAIASFFQERIADTIEKREYPEYMPPAVQHPVAREIWEDVKFTLLLIGLNILILPTIFTLMWPLAYFLLNSYLIGREFFETAAARHIGKQAAKALRRRHRLSTLLAGGLIVGLSLTPLLFLLAPFIGVALSVHLFHSMERRQKLVTLPPQETLA